jgi:hypothetical protein
MKNARWTDERGWIVEDLDHVFWQAPAHPNRGFTTAMWVLMLIGASLISWSAMAHDPGRPELTSRILGQSDQNNGMCCDGKDTFVPAALY